MEHFASRVSYNRVVAQDCYQMEFSWPISQAPIPGQFFSLRSGNSLDPLLRRPFAFSGFDAHSGRASFIYMRRGKATFNLSSLGKDAEIDVLGPLGRGFPECPQDRRPLLFAGGIGLGPMLFLYSQLLAHGSDPLLHLGCRTKAQIAFDVLPESCAIATDDSSYGRPGSVLGFMDGLKPLPLAQVYACGPQPMLKGLSQRCDSLGIDCWVSIEQHMACGVGACAGCSVKVKDERRYLRACKDGPVFLARELVWD